MLTRKTMWMPRTHVKLKMTIMKHLHTITKRLPGMYGNTELACSMSESIFFLNKLLSCIDWFI